MKINIDITGILRVDSKNTIAVDLFSNEIRIDRFALNLEKNEIGTEMRYSVRNMLCVGDSYEDYLKLIKDLGLEIPQQYKKHWIPSPNDKYFCIDSTGEVYGFSYYDEVSCSDNKRIENCNAFPTRELAEKAVNLSKLGRLILLWQYANDCLFIPDWSSDDRAKYYVMYDNVDKKVSCDYNNNFQSDTVYFKTERQAEKFVEMYSEEIEEIMGILVSIEYMVL